MVRRSRRANGAGSIVLAMLLASCSAASTDVASTVPSATATTPASTAVTTAEAATPTQAPTSKTRPKPTVRRSVTAEAIDRRIPVVRGARAALGRPPGAKADRRPDRVAPPQQRFAVLVGITNYRGPTRDTIGSAADARLFRAMLLKAGWLPQNIHLLTDRQVSGDALRGQLRWLAGRSRPGTFTLFHYSGHVKQRGGGREALWPVDRDFVDDTVVAAALGRGTGRMWVNIAGCEAGSFAGDLPSARVLFWSRTYAPSTRSATPRQCSTATSTGSLKRASFGSAPATATTMVARSLIRHSLYLFLAPTSPSG